jgi:hypothetical protein
MSTQDFAVGDFIKIKDDYMWSDTGLFKNSAWVLDRLPVRVIDVVNCNLVIRSAGVPYAPIPAKFVDLLWRPGHRKGESANLAVEFLSWQPGASGIIEETMCFTTQSGLTLAYSWQPSSEKEGTSIFVPAWAFNYDGNDLN